MIKDKIEERQCDVCGCNIHFNKQEIIEYKKERKERNEDTKFLDCQTVNIGGPDEAMDVYWTTEAKYLETTTIKRFEDTYKAIKCTVCGNIQELFKIKEELKDTDVIKNIKIV